MSTVVVVAITLIEVGLLLTPPEAGLAGLVGVLAAHMALAGLALAPFAALPGGTRLRIALAALFIVTAIRLGGDWFSLPPRPPEGDVVSVASWNLEAGARAATDTVATLRTIDADVVALQELDPAAAAAIESDAQLTARFPYRVLAARSDLTGMGVLSVHPLEMPRLQLGPPRQDGHLRHPVRVIRLVNAHPFPAPFGARLLGVPLGFDPSRRNHELDVLRGAVDVDVGHGTPVILLGDFNTSPTEPAFARLTAGLFDAHAEVGFGPGWTWRPSRLEHLGIGLLRLDVILSGPGLRPVATRVECPPTGDHCILFASLAVEDT